MDWQDYVSLEPIGSMESVQKLPDDLRPGYDPKNSALMKYCGWRWVEPSLAKVYYPEVKGTIIERYWLNLGVGFKMQAYIRTSRSNDHTPVYISDLEPQN